MNEILQYLKKHDERSESEIAEATGIPLSDLRPNLAELKDKGQIMMCHSTKFVKGLEIKSTICRISGFIPPTKPGAKPKAKAQATIA